MKILVLTPDGFGGHGGIALYGRNVLTALAAHPSCERVVGLPRVVPLPLEPLPKKLVWDTSGVGGKVRYAKAVARAAREHGPFDLVVASHVNLLPLAYPVARASRAKLALFFYGIDAWRRPNPITARLVDRVDGVITIRRDTTQRFRSWATSARAKDYLLENAIHLDEYGVRPKNEALVAQYGLAGKRVVMTMGRVEERFKGFDEVIEVMPRLAREEPSVVYLVAGDGWDLGRLKAKARTLGVADRVVFTGLVPDALKADHYRLADVYAMPGTGHDFDTYPLRFVFLEAMACGVPVVASRPADEAEARGDGALLARLVDANNPDDVARGILEVLRAPKVGIPAGLHRYAFPSFMRRLHAIVDDVLGVAPRERGREEHAAAPASV